MGHFSGWNKAGIIRKKYLTNSIIISFVKMGHCTGENMVAEETALTPLNKTK